MISNLFLAAEGETGNQYIWIFVALLVVLVVVLLVVPMFTNKKRAKETNELHNSLKPGDVIKTVGGIIGTIIEVRQVSPADKEMVIETGVGDNKTTMVFDIAALYQVVTRAAVEEAPAPVASEEAESATEAIASPVSEEEANAQPETADTAAVADAPVDAAEETAATEEPVAEEPANEETKTADEEVVAVEEAPTEEAQPVAEKPAKKSGGKKSTKK